MNTFQTQNEIGKKGESIVSDIFRRLSDVLDVKDVSDDTDYQADDIDLLVDFRSNNAIITKAIEVKTEPKAAKTGNFFVEKAMEYTKDIYDKDGNLIYEKGYVRKGWLNASKADYICWYVPKIEQIYFCSMAELKRFIKENKPKTAICNDGYKLVCGYLVNIKQFCDFVNVVKKDAA